MGKRSGGKRKRGAAAAPAALSAALSNRKKRQRTADVSVDASPCLPAAVGALRALRTRADAVVDALEWLGDAVLGELVGRCLLAQFRAAAPLSARVFRGLRLAAVSNRNLARAFQLVGYGGVCRPPSLKLKDRADVVEAVVGELALRRALSCGRSDTEGAEGADRADGAEGADGKGPRGELADHLDALLATVLRAHFEDRGRWRRQRQQRQADEAPLAVAFNPFACLPEEQLGERAGELVVVHVPAAPVELLLGDEDRDGDASSAAADLVDEYAAGRRSEGEGGSTGRHHAFAEGPTGDGDEPLEEGAGGDASVEARTRRAMRPVQAAGHVLQASREVFEVFKVYGMAALTERVSLLLALPPLAALDRLSPVSLRTSPSELTRARQRVLSVAHLAACATALGVASPPAAAADGGGESGAAADGGDDPGDDERLRANTLRAFVGFHSALATASAAGSPSSELVNDICLYIHARAVAGWGDAEGRSSDGDGTTTTTTTTTVRLPPREPLVALMRSVGEARAFLRSKTCDELHAPGERPRRAAPPPGRPRVLLRQCDSDEVEDLFGVLARDVERQEQAQRRRAEDRTRAARRPKRAKAAPAAALSLGGQLATLERFRHRRFLFCLEELVVLFAQRRTDECRAAMRRFERDLEPCAEPERVRKWDVSTSTLTLAMRDGFFRLLLHDLSHFHALASSSKTTRDGTRVTQLRLPLHYAWAKRAGRRLTDEALATC